MPLLTQPHIRWHQSFAACVIRQLNPRYSRLPRAAFDKQVRILDVGAGPGDAKLAKRLYRGCHFEAFNIAPLDPDQMKTFDAYYVADLNAGDLSRAPDNSFDYVISSHTIEHLNDGRIIVEQLCDKVRSGGQLYLEWPSVESMTFPIRGVGLNFFDDPTHVRTFAIDEISNILTSRGFLIDHAGVRRIWLRSLFSPILIVLHSIQNRRIVLFDLWDLTRFCYVLMGTKE